MTSSHTVYHFLVGGRDGPTEALSVFGEYPCDPRTVRAPKNLPPIKLDWYQKHDFA